MYQREAQGLASLGRGPDTELVHMTPREVGALDNLARRNGLSGLPINPQTGLPETGIFNSILPLLIGAGATAAAPFTGGGSLAAFLGSPLAMGATAGLGAGIASGFDAAQMAKWGLGVYGGADLAGSLASAGSGTAVGGAAGTAGTAGTAEASKAMAEQSLAKTLAAEKALATNPATSAFGQAVQRGTTNVGLNIGDMARPFTSLANLKTIPAAVGKAPVLAGVGSLAADHYIRQRDFEPDPLPEKEKPFYPEGGFLPLSRRSVDPFAGEQFASDRGEGLYFDPEPFTSPGYTYREGGLISLNKGGNVPAPSMAVPIPDVGESTYFDPSRMTALVAGPQTQTNADAFVRMGEGVPIDEWSKFRQADKKRYKLNHDTLDMNLIRDHPKSILGRAVRGLPHVREQFPLTDTNEYVPRQATGISATLPVGINPDAQEMTYFNQGGLTRGSGDGMSDNIMLPIKGSRDIAAVSPDEFVVSADVVAGLGNGSTSAGAKQLYGMMDRVRKARTGKKSQPRAIDVNKMMPV